MALVSIPPGLNLIAWTGPVTTLAQASWFTTTNLNGVYKPAANRLGFISSKPGSAFPGFTQITPAATGGIPACYIFNVKVAFSLDDSLLGIVSALPPAPTVSSISPTSGAAGDTVTITGTNLSNALGVAFGPVLTAAPSANTATSITAVVPTLASTGAVRVFTAGGIATGPTFSIALPIYQLQNEHFRDNILALSRTGYTIRNPFSSAAFILPAGVSSFDVQVTSNLSTGVQYNSLREFSARVNGVYQHIPVTNTAGAFYTVPAPSGATIELFPGFLEKAPSEDFRGVFPTAIRVAGTPTFLPFSPPQKRLLILGDSIPTGAFATNPGANAAPNLVADELATLGWRVTREMYSGRALADDYAETSDRAGFISRLAAGLDGTSENVLYIELSTNDGDAQTLANRYGAFVDAIHAAKPTARIIAQLTAFRADANSGNNYVAKRTAIANLAGIRPWLEICTASEITAVHLNLDNVHFTTAGHRVLADLIKFAVLNPPALVTENATILSPQQRQLTPVGTWYEDQVPGYVSSQGYASVDINAKDSFTFTGIGFDVNSIRSQSGAPVSLYISPTGQNNFQLLATSTQYASPNDQATIFSIRGLTYGTYDVYTQLTTPAVTGLIADQVVIYAADPAFWQDMAFSPLNADTQVSAQKLYTVNKAGGAVLPYVSQSSRVLAAGATGGVRMKFDGQHVLGILCLSTAAGAFGYAEADFSAYFGQSALNAPFNITRAVGSRSGAAAEVVTSQVPATNSFVRLWRGSDMHVRLEYSANGSDWTSLHDYGVSSGVLYPTIDVGNTSGQPQMYGLLDPEHFGFTAS